MSARDADGSMVVWLNDRFLPVREATISPLDRGFLYGDGLFETMRAEDGRVLFLEEHLHRLREGLTALRIPADTEVLPWRERLIGLLERNKLGAGSAAVKIVVSRGARPGLGLPADVQPTVLVTATRYDPPSPEAYESGWRLHTFHGAGPVPLARHKTLGYLLFLAARQEALDAGADEALLVDPVGAVAETAAGSLLVLRGGTWMRPASPFQLQGITVRTVARMLAAEGAEVIDRRLSREDLLDAEAVWILGSLAGIMPARSLDGTPLSQGRAALARSLRQRLTSC